MDLPDCPPGAEGYEDSVVEIPKKPDTDGQTCTKAELEFQEHLNSLKIKLDNGDARCMVERRDRDISGKWTYLCFPCGSVCSGESILQTHLSGKKHKGKLALRNTWPKSIFDDHPYNQTQKSGGPASSGIDKMLKKIEAEGEVHKAEASDIDQKLNKYRQATCHIQDILDALKAPLVGVEYLVEHPPEKAHYEPSYLCTLCTKQGHPRTIINHLTCYWHRYNFMLRHFPKACQRFASYKSVPKYREGIGVTMHRLCQRVEDKFGRLKPVNIDKEEYEKSKDQILQWIFRGFHFSEKSGITLEEVVDGDLIESLAKASENNKKNNVPLIKKKDPSPPVVAAPSKPNYSSRHGRRERRVSIDSLSDISDEAEVRRPGLPKDHQDTRPEHKPRPPLHIEEHRREIENFRSRFQVKEPESRKEDKTTTARPANYQYKVKLAEEKMAATAESAAATLAYHEKNPEKHPLYPEEWKKFWNRRYKEIQAEGKDASKHDFKPEWIVFWTKRMKELHQDELQLQVTEICRRMNITPPNLSMREEPPRLEQRHIPERHKSPEPRKRSPEPRKRSQEPRRRSPVWNSKRRSPEHRGRDDGRRSSDRRRSPDSRHRSPGRWPDYRAERKTPDPRYKMDRTQVPARHSPAKRTRSRSPVSRRRSPARTHITLESVRRSRSPLSRRDSELRNRSPLSRRDSELRNRSPARRGSEPQDRNRSPVPEIAPSMQTVMISDDELKPDDGLSPWNSDNDISSVGSAPRSRAGSAGAAPRRAPLYAARLHAPDLGPPENVVSTLRVLVALEDYLGSLGPKIVDLLTEALRMEKECGNSSEDLLERESALVLMETAKEKLKGAVQAGLVAPAAEPALRAAIVRAAATLHEADTRTRKRQAKKKLTKAEAMPVAGVGQVDRAQIAQQMAAALIAQGKTDVTSEELAQLVDAVVGMAEAKKREAEATKTVKATPPLVTQPPPAKMSGTATALQMLQSAYDENDKKSEKEDAPDAMDGLSDSDLETLLKNFNELSAEEQHSLIAYLKKLEAREPQRVERLRQYVSADATTATPPAEEPPAHKSQTKTVTIESDDDDYTVEEVFQSATKKVKEDQIRKELDIVTKSLEESKEEEAPSPPIKAVPITDLSKHLSSASNLFALVQASIKSTATASPATKTKTIDVVTSNTQPRSFGDITDTPCESLEKPQNSPIASTSESPNTPFDMQDDSTQQSQDQLTFNRDYQNDSYDQQPQWEQRQRNNTPDNRGPRDQGDKNFGQAGSLQFRDFGQNQFGPGSSKSGPNSFDQGSNLGPNKFGQGPNSGINQFGQGSNSGPNQFGQGSNSGQNQFGQGSKSGQNQFGQGSNSGQNQFGQGSNSGPNQFGQGSNSGQIQFGQGPNSGPNRFSQGPNSGPNQFGKGSNSGPSQFGQRSNSGPNQFGQGPNLGANQFGQGSNIGPKKFGQGLNLGPNIDRQGNPGQTNWQGPHQFNQGLNPYHHGSRGSMNGRMGDNRPLPLDMNMNRPQFGIYDNFRGRGGRGNFGGGPMRARGRGRF